MGVNFEQFLDRFIENWQISSLREMKKIISKNYQAREITGGEIDDFGYEDSINGWEQGFTFLKENNAEWDLHVHSIIPLREKEMMAIIFAGLIINGKKTSAGNLFFDTFKLNASGEWKLVRSYVEAGVSGLPSKLHHEKEVCRG